MKFYKNIFFALAVLVIVFSCDPLEDTYDELDVLEDESGANSQVSIGYTLTSDDYVALASALRSNGSVEDSTNADFIDQYSAFNASIEFSDLLEDFANDNYPQLQKGAAIRITYSLLEGEDFTDGSAEYVNAPNYTLDADDYTSVSASAGSFGFFDRDINATNEVASILLSNAQGVEAGDVWSATYEFVDVSYSALAGETLFTEPFETTLNGFESINILGDDQVWAWGSFGDDTYARMSGFSGGAIANEDWLVSPAIDLTDADGPITLFLTQILNFQGPAEWGQELDILISEDYTGDVTTATWTSLGTSQSAFPEGDSFDLFDNEISLPDAAGKTIYLAFSYKSTDSDAALWEIVNIRIDVGAAPDTDEVNVFYEFDGSSWSTIEDEAYYLGSADYDAMGESSGQPGRFDNFSDDTPPEDYLPTFLADRFPFAQEGDEFVLVYEYFAGGTSTRGSVYTVSSGVWTPAVNEDQFVVKTDQYVNTGDGFVFNPSVELTMVSSDYQLIVDEVAKTRPELINSFGTGEDLYGADAFFVNFDIRLSSRLENGDDGNPLQPEYVGLSDEDAQALIDERLVEGVDVFLEARFTDVEPIDGIEILYTVNFATFDGNGGSGTLVYILTGVGTFEPYTEN